MDIGEKDNAGFELSVEYFGSSIDEDNDEKEIKPEELTVEENETTTSETSIEELEKRENKEETEEISDKKGLLEGPLDINLRDTDGNGKNYLFTYDGEDFSAVYTTDNWRIYDSYKITNTDDITIICEALTEVHQVHGSDMESFRTPDDMAYEWLQHNLAYMFLSDDNPWKIHAKNVDLDPKDQGKSFDEIYEDRTGKEFNLGDFFKNP